MTSYIQAVEKSIDENASIKKDLDIILVRLSAIEAILARLEAINAYTIPYTWKDCGCSTNTVCMNSACPRQTRVTCETK